MVNMDEPRTISNLLLLFPDKSEDSMRKIYQENNSDASATINAVRNSQSPRRNIFGNFFESGFDALGNIICCAKQSSHTSPSNTPHNEYVEINIGKEFGKNLTDKFSNAPLELPIGFQPVIQIPVTLGKQLHLAYVEAILRQQEGTPRGNRQISIDVKEEEDDVIKRQPARSEEFLSAKKKDSLKENNVTSVVGKNEQFRKSTTEFDTTSSVVTQEAAIEKGLQEEFIPELQRDESSSKNVVKSNFPCPSDLLPVSKQGSHIEEEGFSEKRPVVFQEDFPVNLSREQNLLSERLLNIGEHEDDLLSKPMSIFKARHNSVAEDIEEDPQNYNNTLSTTEETVDLNLEQFTSIDTNFPVLSERRWSTEKQGKLAGVHGHRDAVDPQNSYLLGLQKPSAKDKERSELNLIHIFQEVPAVKKNQQLKKSTTELETRTSSVIRQEAATEKGLQDELLFTTELQIDESSSKNDVKSNFPWSSDLLAVRKQGSHVEDLQNYNNTLSTTEETVDSNLEQFTSLDRKFPVLHKRRSSTEKQGKLAGVHGHRDAVDPQNSYQLGLQKPSAKDKERSELNLRHIFHENVTECPQVQQQTSKFQAFKDNVLRGFEAEEHFHLVDEDDLATPELEQSAVFQREQARKHFRRRGNYYQVAKRYLAENNHQRAKEYFRKAEEEKELHQSANNRAVIAIACVNRGRNPDEDTIDLHNLYVKEAIRILDNFLDYKISSLRDENLETKSLTVITGRGKHSQNGIPKIKPAVGRRLKKRNLKYFEANPGSLTVEICIR